VSGDRARRIARVIREEASRVVLYELADPRIGFVTVTRVKVSGDLQQAKVFVSIMGDETDRKSTMTALSRAATVVQRAVGPRLKTRLVPHVSFEFDPSVEGAIRVSHLIKEARATDADGGRGREVGTDGEPGGADSEEGEET
jgi:ribosome-binding factor A